MKTNIFNIVKQLVSNVNRKIVCLGMILCTFGVMNVCGAVVSGTTYNVNNSSTPDGWTLTGSGSGSYWYLTSSGIIETNSFCASNIASVTLQARKYGGPSNAQAKITVYWVNSESGTATSLGTTTPSNTTLTDYPISTNKSLSPNEVGYIRIKCAGANSSKGSGVSQVTINYTTGSCGSSSYTIYYSGGTYVSGSGTVSIDAEGDEAEEDDVVTVTATPSSASYYVSSIAAYDESWDEVSLSRVDETHYTFTMPASDVYVYTVFSALPSYSITYNTPICVTSPSGTLTSQSRFATPSESVPGYRFEGWVASAIPGTTGSKPGTIYQPGEVIPNNNMTVYALYSQVSATFTKQTGSTMPVDGGNYMLCNSYSSTARVIKNAVDASKRATTKEWDCSGTTTTCTDWECIWVFKQGTGAYSDYWFIYNPQVGKYLGANSATAHASSPANYEVKLIDGMSDASAWTCTVSSGRITLVNKLRSGTSGTNETKLMSSGNYAGFGYSSGTAPYFFKNDAVSASYTTNPTCPTTDHTITFNANGGSGSMSPITDIEDGTGATLTSNTFSKDGYSFGGWTADVTVTIGGSPVSPGSTIANGATLQNITSDINLTAIWTPNPYRVDVASPGHVTIGVSSPTTIAEGAYANVNCGATVTLSESSLDAGYAAVWKVYKTGDESTTVSVSGSGNGATFTMPAYPVTVTKTITAPWIYFTSCSSVLTVTYNANGGTGNVPVDATEYAKNDNVTVLGNVGIPSTLSKDGYTFGGWQAGGVGDVYEAGDSYTITSNTTFYAVWTPNNYKITSISTSPASSGTVTAEYNSAAVVVNSTNIPCGSTVTLSQTPNRDKTFTGWTVTNTTKSESVTVTSNQFTMPAGNVTVVANYSAKSSCVVTFSLQSGTISTTTIGGTNYTTEVTLYEGESITTMPTVSSISCGDWGTVVGWTANSSYSESTTPPSYVSAPYNPGSNITLYAVYRKTDGSADFDGTNSGTYYVRGTSSSTDYYASSCPSGSLIEDNATSTASATPFDITKNGDYYNISCTDGKYVTTSGIQSGTDASADAAKWSVAQVGSTGGEGSGYWLFRNKGDNTKAFAFDARYSQKRFNTSLSYSNVSNSGNSDYVPVALISASTNYYSINPACGTTYDITKGTCTPGSSVLDASSEYCDFSLSTSSVSSGGSVTVTLLPNDDYTYNASSVTITGGGSASVGAINVVEGNIVCNITGITADMTVNVTFVAKPKYTVTLYDNGVQRTTLTEEHYNAGVTLPSGNNCTPTSPFTFVGWTESAVELNADPVRPASATLHAAGDYTPTSDITLYSVYSRSVAGCDDFAAGVSGAYKIYYDGSKYALTTGSTTYYNGGTSGDAEVFYFAYAPAHSGYTIRTSEGYLGWGGSSGSETISKGNATPYYWKVSGSSSNWVITPEPSGITRQFKSSDGSRFQMYASGTSGKAILQKSAMTYYYNTAICGGAQITFHDGGGTISGTPTTPTGASWNSGTHVLSGLEDCDKITTFPTANYDGWTFIGWSTEDYSNSGKHTADHPEENASTDEPDGSEIYKTGGNSYTVRGGSIDLYPVFTRFPENETFDLTQDEIEAYIYYMAPGTNDGYGANKRVYATAYDGEKRYVHTTNCAAATKFTFEKQVSGKWTIYDNDTKKYLVDKNDDWLCQQASTSGAEWTISLYSGNQFDAYCNYENYHIIAWDNGSGASEARFQNYSKTGLTESSTLYHRVYLGSCTERIFSSEPNPTPTIDLTGEPYVTATNGQEIRATATMTVSAAHLSSVSANKVIVSGGTGLRFATAANVTPTATVSLSLTEGNLAATTIYVYYNPSATEDGLENIVVTAKAYNGSSPKDLQTTGTVHARHLPADFVIAAKWEGKWYALPNTCTFDGSSTAGVLITVDNDNDPTEATYAPSSTKWGLRKTKAGSRVDGSHNDRMVFTERTTATADDQKTLYNYNSAEVFANAMYANYNNTNPTRYEWTPVSSDFKDYTLTNASESKPLILRNDCEFKAQTTNQAYDGKVRLLPATFYEDNVQIIEWKTNSVVIMYTGSETTAKAKAGSNSETSSQTLSSQKLTHGIYEVTTGTALTSHTGENLILTFGSPAAGKKIFEIPWIINGSANATSGHEKQDVVILNNGKLTAQPTKYSFRNIYVYGGGKLKIASGTSLGVNNIILRAGRISTNGTGGSATYNYDYPQVELGGTLTSTKTDIKYEYITDYDHWYHLCLPFDATLNSIHYPTEYYGQNVKEDNKGSWIIKRYDGATRATGNYAAWVDIESESATVASAGHGYIFWGAPKKISVGGAAKVRQQWGIQRMTMSVAAATATAAETANKTVDGLGSYASVPGNSGKVNDQGWNLIGNPYLMNLSGLNSTSLKTGKLIEEVIGGNKTGHWVSNNDGVRYVTVPDNHFDNYTAQTMAWFTSSNPMVAGRAFFVQIDGDATAVQFNTADRKALLPALFAKVEESVDIETGIVMSDESKHDEVNFWIKDGKTAAYEKNADYPKTPNSSNFNIYGVHETCDLSWIAISPEIAEGSMAIGYQVPAAGEYRLSLSETYVTDKIEQLLVTDHAMNPEVTTNLMAEDYFFQVNQAETNNERFTVSIKIKSGTQITTDIDDIRGDSEHPYKFIYRDKMYIKRGDRIYDATGKQVQINK